MRKFVMMAVVVALAGGAAAYFGVFSRNEAATTAPGAGGGARGSGAQRAQGGGGPGGPGGGFSAGPRLPMTVEVGPVAKGSIAAHLTVVGNLVGEQTVDVAPKTGGRLVSVNVQLGDPVRKGQLLAKLDDQEIVEQVNQAKAAMDVANATIRQREADLKVAELNFDRSKNLFARQLLAKQSLDDAESKFLAAQAQIDLARAQAAQTAARLEELNINLANTRVTSPVDGFVGRRNVDPGAWVSQNLPVASVVEISKLRLVANVVERDLRMVTSGDPATVEVDAYPGEVFTGRVARVAPVLDPTTRTAVMEIEIPNKDVRLKPGMYARVALTIEEHTDVLVAAKSSVVDYEDKRGVFTMGDDNKARFIPVEVGIEDADRVEIRQGVKAGDRIVTAGASSLRANDQLIIAGQGGPTGRPGGTGGRGGMGGGRPGGGQGARPAGTGGDAPAGGGARPPAQGGQGQRPPNP